MVTEGVRFPNVNLSWSEFEKIRSDNFAKEVFFEKNLKSLV